MSGASPLRDGLGFPGVPGISSSYNLANSESVDSAVMSDISEDMLSSELQSPSPNSLAQTSKKLWSDSSSWLISRISYQSQSQSSNNSSMDRSPAALMTGGGQYRDPTAVERSNLLNITKLVIKELIEWSIRHARSLESDHPPLQHFFIVLEHALRHGLKPKKGLLGPKKELWDVLQMVEKCTNEALDITSSIRDLPTVSTHLGRARAWLRLALMQKKLADYVKILLDNREILSEFYEPIALMMSDEATILSGLLVGLNVIDCNFCLKEDDLDSQQGVIDFSLYLRSTRSSDSGDDDAEPNNMDSVLDQKNYIEELNRHLNATVTNLQTRVETLTTTNALMKEDLAISKNTILSFQNENQTLKLRLSHYTGGADPLNSENASTQKKGTKIPTATFEQGGGDAQNSTTNKILNSEDGVVAEMAFQTSVTPAELSVTDLSKKLHEERDQRAELEKKMEIQANQKAEMEMAMKLMETDVHEKQDTIITLRRQLDDIKTINLEMYRKLQECEKSLKYKTELVVALEAKAVKLGETIDGLNEKYARLEAEMKLGHETMRSLGVQIADKELKVSTLEGDLRIEREWRQSLQDNLVKDKEKISELNMAVQELQLVTLELETCQLENARLAKSCKEHEQTLTDMGVRLSQSTLEMEDLREASVAFAEGQWAHDKEVTNCTALRCNKEFSLTRRKHHCRNCGKIFCKQCSDNMMQLPSSAKPVRICDLCYPILLQRCKGEPIPDS